VGTVANSELVAEEIVRTLVGSIGLVASVPVTTALAALVVSADRPGSATVPAGGPTGPAGTQAGAQLGAQAGTYGPQGAQAPQPAAARGGRGRRRKH
jgi:hypothetical protein